jgi:hypothetical protein
MLLEDAETSLNKMPKVPLREDQDASTALREILKRA